MNHESGIVWRFAPLRKSRENVVVDQSRRSFLVARRLAKRLILSQENRAEPGEATIDIVSRNRSGRGIRPEISIDGHPVSWCLSISHTDTAVLVALGAEPGVSIGVDLVKNEPLGPGFAAAWLDDEERCLAEAGDRLEVCRLWAAKEAAYKAINRGDPFAPRRVQIRRSAAGGYTCVYRDIDLTGRCRINVWPCDDHLAALAVFHPSLHPCGPVNPDAAELSISRR
ncbi:MAG TPA: 4'-phosphopantetheinyl transferase superfamily protein [Thermoguttaceae bacterium]|nr:4'-phosphopantetheinyl transferase superfamily protein [Thermoguttaceae bacterium]